jgi:hypothetical protein
MNTIHKIPEDVEMVTQVPQQLGREENDDEDPLVSSLRARGYIIIPCPTLNLPISFYESREAFDFANEYLFLDFFRATWLDIWSDYDNALERKEAIEKFPQEYVFTQYKCMIYPIPRELPPGMKWNKPIIRPPSP